MQTKQLTVQLPEMEINFLEDYANRHQITVSKVIDYLIEQLQISEKYVLHPDIEKHSGILPKDIDAEKEYYGYLEEKHK